ncbi:unnamed protein product, partial [marine sediment metagenome]
EQVVPLLEMARNIQKGEADKERWIKTLKNFKTFWEEERFHEAKND